jgi:glyoxylase-like metal-dependent hydrolase (beta-lactamase superfamily II)
VSNGASTVQIFEDYQLLHHLAVPQLTSFSVNRQLVYRDTLKEFKINVASGALGLKLPVKYVRTKEYDGPLLVRKLAGHTYIIEKVDGDRNVIFRDMGDHILLTEAPVSSGTVKAIIAKIASVFPDKPIKYVHLSHFHKDHIAGIAELVALGATIICTPETSKPVMDLISQSFSGTDKKYAPKFLYINKTLQLGRSENCIKFYAIYNTHAKGMSFAYLPTEKIIYQGDLLSLPEDGTPTAAIQVNNNFFKALRLQKLDYKLVVGHHGLPEITAFTIHQMEAKAKNHL